ncbi:MAG TPA: putative cobaltochelatase [Patescibacteria group bacterium]|nr:putative cobaltochelatase [Patescibacteria group bacterium]
MHKMTKQRRTVYPFAALAGQEELQLGLLLHAVNPRLGGILIRGEKGTAKSTAVRALASLLPEMDVVSSCAYHCDPAVPEQLCPDCRQRLQTESGVVTSVLTVPVIDLPVSATEDRVVGSLDFEQALQQGCRAFQPGLMAEANRGIIYIDEINLLDDHIVDVLLDAAGSGVNVVEREGISVTHPAQFILVGTMNPEEGDLRPQLLDRFALCADVQGLTDREARVDIMKRRDAFEADPSGFQARWQPQQEGLANRIAAARQLLGQVNTPQDIYEYISELCAAAYTAGHRADIVLDRAASTLTAWRGLSQVTRQEVDDIAPLVLAHRRRQPPEESETPQNQEEPEESEEEDNTPPPPSEPPDNPPDQKEEREEQPENQDEKEDKDKNNNANPSQEVVFAVGKPFAVKRISHDKDRQARRGSGRRSRTKTDSSVGRYVKSTSHRERDDLAIDATIRAAAPFQRRRRLDMAGPALLIENSDIREKVREKRIGNFMMFVVDASGSMGANQRMIETKGAILSLLLDAYQKRDKVGMVAFKGDRAEVLLPPTNSVELAQRCLSEMPVGGKTPLAAGLTQGFEMVRQQLKRSPHMRPIMVILSDGKANVSMDGGKPMEETRRTAQTMREELAIKYLVIDTEKKGLLTFGLARDLAEQLGGEYYTIDQLQSEGLAGIVRGALA